LYDWFSERLGISVNYTVLFVASTKSQNYQSIKRFRLSFSERSELSQSNHFVSLFQRNVRTINE
jgi:hypothetical protein